MSWLHSQSVFLGVILRDCKVPFANKGCVVLSDPTPMLVYPVHAPLNQCFSEFHFPIVLTACAVVMGQISSNEVRVLIDFPEDKLPSASTGESCSVVHM